MRNCLSGRKLIFMVYNNKVHACLVKASILPLPGLFSFQDHEQLPSMGSNWWVTPMDVNKSTLINLLNSHILAPVFNTQPMDI